MVTEEQGERGTLTHLLHNVGRKDTGCESSAENVREFLVQTSNSHLLKVPFWVDDGLPGLLGLGLACKHASGITSFLITVINL